MIFSHYSFLYFECLSNAIDEPRTIGCSSMIDITSLRIDFDKNLEMLNSVMCDSVMVAEIEIYSHLPASVLCHEIDVTLKQVKVAVEAGNAKPTNRLGAKKSVSEKSVAPQSEIPDEALLLNQTLSSTDYLIIKEQKHLKQDGSLSSVALTCPNVNQFLG